MRNHPPDRQRFEPSRCLPQQWDNATSCLSLAVAKGSDVVSSMLASAPINPWLTHYQHDRDNVTPGAFIPHA